MERRTFLPLLGTGLIGLSQLSMGISDRKEMEKSGKILPKRLKKGDTIGIAAPAGGIKSTNEISEFTEVLKNLGFKTIVAPHVSGKFGYFSAPDETRASEFMELIENSEVNAIFFIRGGWGCARLLEHLDFDLIKTHPKIIMGFSDITTLLNAISYKTGLITFHGPGGNSTWNDYSLAYIKSVLMDGSEITYSNVSGIDSTIITLKEGIAEGELYGGNLSVLCGLIGSEYLPDWKGKILFLEDVAEEPYRIDRMLTHLRLAGVLDAVNGVILGNFRNCIAEEPNRSFTLEEVFEQHFSSSGIPVFYGAQFGHVRNKFTLPVGINVKMDAKSGTIELSIPSVN
jgi:muramoyltetrapeptide carboxypeptidase